MATKQEWRAFEQFVAECSRLWPGAKITLPTNSEFARQSASARVEASGETDKTHNVQKENKNHE